MKFFKTTLILKIVIGIVTVLFIQSVGHIINVGVEPVIATDIALGQVDDTTAGHALQRSYDNSGLQKALRSKTAAHMLSFLAVIGFIVLPITRRVLEIEKQQQKENEGSTDSEEA